MDAVIEILIKQILSKIPNVVNQLRLRRVSTTWSDIIEKIFEQKNLWKELCRNDYIYPWVYHITELIFHNQIRIWPNELLSKTWKEIYTFYNQWSSIVTSSNIYFQFSNYEDYLSFNGDAYSIDVQGDKIAINIKQKKIFLTTIKDLEQKILTPLYGFDLTLLYQTKLRSKKITKIKLWNTDTSKWILIIHFTRKGNRTLKYLDIDKREELRNPFRSQKNIQNFTIAGHRLFIATSDVVYECKYTESRGLVLGQDIFEFRNVFNRSEMEQLDVLAMSATSTFKIIKLSLLMKTSGDTVRVINFKISPDEHDKFKLMGCDRDIRIQVDAMLFYIPMPGIVFIAGDIEMVINLWYNITETHMGVNDVWERVVPLEAPVVLDLSRDNELRSSTSSNTNSIDSSQLLMLRLQPMKVTCIFFFCNILFLGLQSARSYYDHFGIMLESRLTRNLFPLKGEIIIYIADSIKSFIRNDFYKLPKRRLRISDNPIIAINIIVQHGTMFMTATTPKAIHVSHLLSDQEFY